MCWSTLIICTRFFYFPLYDADNPGLNSPQHFVYPCSINATGYYNVPSDAKEGYSIEMKETSIAEFEFPHGSYWASVGAGGSKSVRGSFVAEEKEANGGKVRHGLGVDMAV